MDNNEVKELESLLREAYQVLDDWCDEYGHYELEQMRNKIGDYFSKRHLTSRSSRAADSCTLCHGTGIMPGTHDVEKYYKD